MDIDILNCCALMQQNETCPYASYFEKDVYDPHYYNLPAILMSVLSVLSLSVLFFVIRNIVKIFKVRGETDIQSVAIMNTCVGLATICNFNYFA